MPVNTENHGQILEHLVRRSGRSIQEVAIAAGIDRRSLYNWFKQPQLRQSKLIKMGKVLGHDFGIQVQPKHKGQVQSKTFKNTDHQGQTEPTDSLWKHKYLSLLESYNELLDRSIQIEENIL